MPDFDDDYDDDYDDDDFYDDDDADDHFSKEVFDTELQARTFMVSLLKKFDEGAYADWPACFGIVQEFGKKYRCCYVKRGVCHAELNDFRGETCKDIIAYYTNVTCKTEQGREYFRFILDPKASPWKMVLNDSEIIQHEDGKPFGLCINGAGELPLQVVANLSIALRCDLEHSNVLPISFVTYCEAGFDRYQALWLAGNYTTNKKSLYKAPGSHFPFNGGFVVYSRIKNCAPRFNKAQLFKSGLGYKPVNAIWEEQDIQYHGAEASPGLLAKVLTFQESYTGVFGRHHVRMGKLRHDGKGGYIFAGMPSFEKAIELLKDKSQELFV